MNGAPPSRYRVVERGRRLEVIDSRAGTVRMPVNPEPAQAKPMGLARFLPRQTRFDGTAEIVTHRLYDAKAPRTVTLDPVLTGRFEWMKIAALFAIVIFVGAAIAFPWLFAAPVLIHMLGTGAHLRKWATRKIDGIIERS